MENDLQRVDNLRSAQWAVSPRELVQPQRCATRGCQRCVIIEGVMAEMAASSLRPNQYQVRRTMTKYWNEVVDIFAALSCRRLRCRHPACDVPVSRSTLSRCRFWMIGTATKSGRMVKMCSPMMLEPCR